MKRLNSIYIPTALLIAAAGLHAQIVVDKTSLTFSGQLNGQVQQQTINVTAPSGSSAQVFFVASVGEQTSPSVQWLKFAGNVTGTNGTTPATLTVLADPTGLAAGAYSGNVVISPSPFTDATKVTIPVTFTVSAIGVSSTSLSFTYQSGATVPGAQSVTLSGSSPGFTAAASTTSGGNWLLATPASGTFTNGLSAVSVLLDQTIVPTLAAGVYNGTVTITPVGATNNTPVSIAVTLTVTVPPPVTVSSNSIQLNYQIGGANNSPQQVLTISTTGSQQLTYSVSFAPDPNPSGRSFIIANPSSGVIPANGSTQVTISYDTTANLPAGTWTGTLTLFSSGSPSQQTIKVNLLVSSLPLLSVPTAGLTFIYEVNSGVAPPAQNVALSSTAVAPGAASGQMSVAASATTTNGGNWLNVNPLAGSTGSASPFVVSANPTGLVPGTYKGSVTFTGVGAGNGAQTVPVTLTVANDPALTTNLSSVTFAQQVGQNPVAATQTSQVITVGSSTGATLNYTATTSTTPAGGSWLSVNGNSTGNTNNSFTVSVSPTGLTAGTYSGAITITATNPATGNPAINSPLTIPVTFTLSATPVLVVTLPGNPPAQPVFTAAQQGASPPTQIVTLNSSNPAVNLNYTVSFTTASGGTWLFATPQNGTTAQGQNQVQVGALPGILSAGTYTGTVTITATTPSGTTGDAGTYNIPVKFLVTQGTLTLNPGSLQFSQLSSGPAPATQNIQVSGGGQKLNYSAVTATTSSVNWLSVSPANGNTTDNPNLTVSVDGSKLTPGTYNGTITVTSPNAAGSPATVNVTLTVTAGTLSATPTSLTFTQTLNGPAPQSQSISVSGTPSSLNFTVAATTTSGGNWLTAAVTGGAVGGSTPGTVQVSVNAGTLAIGQYSGTVTIASPGASGSPINVPVTLNVVAPQTITVTPTGTVSFNYIIGAAAPQAQQIQVTSSGTTTFTTTVKTTDGANWLSVSPTSGILGTTATNLAISVNPTGLAAGNYTGTVTINSPNAATPTVVNVSLAVVAIPPPSIVGIRNAASGATGSISPGENIVLFGTGIGPNPLVGLQVVNGKVATTVGQTQVLFDGTIAAPIIYASANQTSVMVPYEIAGRPTTNITVVYQGVSSTPLTYSVVTSQPGIYTQNLSGSGPGAIVNQDFSVNGPTKPAPVGSAVAVYMTGEGNTTPQAITGGIAPLDGSGLNKPAQQVTATVAGASAQVVYAGSAPGFVYGAAQVNVVIPPGTPSGPQPVTIFIGGVATQAAVTVQVQ